MRRRRPLILSIVSIIFFLCVSFVPVAAQVVFNPHMSLSDVLLSMAPSALVALIIVLAYVATRRERQC